MSSILFEISHQVGWITLNRPEKLNSFTREMALSLQAILQQCEDPSIRAVYLTGAGKAFCAGQDLAEVMDPQGPGMARILAEHYNPLVRAIRNLQKPVVAAVNGVAAGAGANLALCCDIIVATESAAFIQAFSKIGLVPDTGGTYFLPRLIGWQKASALMMLGDKITARKAEQMGMIYTVWEDQEFSESSRHLAFQLAQMPTQGLAYTKQALQKSYEQDLLSQLALEDQLQQQAAGTHDFAEGVQAFLEKRKPQFNGK